MSETPRMDPRAERSRTAGLAAARAVLLEEGWEAVTQPRIAERAGIGRATVYRHWPSRAALLLELLNAEAVSMHGEFTGSLRDDLIGEMERFVGVIAQPGWNQVFAAFVYYTATDPEIRTVMDRMAPSNLSLFTKAVEQAILAGELAPDTDPHDATAKLMGPIMYWFLIPGRPPTADFIESVVDEFIATHSSMPRPAGRKRISAAKS